MAGTKAVTTTFTSQAVGAGVTTSTQWTQLTGNGGELGWSIANGTAPTSSPYFSIYISPDNGTTVRYLTTVYAGTAASTTYTGVIPIDDAVMYVGMAATGGATNGSTFVSEIQQITY